MDPRSNPHSNPATGRGRRFTPLFLLAGGFLVATALQLPAAVVISVDVSNPAAVTFTATGAPADVADASTTTLDGVTLLSFFQRNLNGSLLLPGDLTPSGGAAPDAYTQGNGDNASGSFVDFNLFDSSEGGLAQTFTTTSAAFSGSGTANFNFSLDALPVAGATGDLLAGWSGNPGEIIGQWAVVPEVSTVAQAGVMVLALAGWMGWRRAAAHNTSV